jgi:hypothetical protein
VLPLARIQNGLMHQGIRVTPVPRLAKTVARTQQLALPVLLAKCLMELSVRTLVQMGSLTRVGLARLAQTLVACVLTLVPNVLAAMGPIWLRTRLVCPDARLGK